jgi:hypothetical protein
MFGELRVPSSWPNVPTKIMSATLDTFWSIRNSPTSGLHVFSLGFNITLWGKSWKVESNRKAFSYDNCIQVVPDDKQLSSLQPKVPPIPFSLSEVTNEESCDKTSYSPL